MHFIEPQGLAWRIPHRPNHVVLLLPMMCFVSSRGIQEFVMFHCGKDNLKLCSSPKFATTDQLTRSCRTSLDRQGLPAVFRIRSIDLSNRFDSVFEITWNLIIYYINFYRNRLQLPTPRRDSLVCTTPYPTHKAVAAMLRWAASVAISIPLVESPVVGIHHFCYRCGIRHYHWYQ